MSTAETPIPSLRCRFLDAATQGELAAAFARAGDQLRAVLGEFPAAAIQQSIYAIAGPRPHHYLPEDVPARLAEVGRLHGAAALGAYKKYLVLRFIADIDGRIDAQGLPDSVLAYYPEMLAFVARDLLAADDESYLAAEDALIRELRLVSLRSIPAGARIVDRDACIPPSFYRFQGLAGNLRCLWFIRARLGGLGPLYRSHIELRCRHHATEQGYTDVYLRIAEMMRRDPAALGAVGTSWLVDPQIERVSPHLSYVRRLLTDNGAFLRNDGTGEQHTERALATSKTRRAHYEAGTYQPTCYTVIWPRRDLLDWADRYQVQP